MVGDCKTCANLAAQTMFDALPKTRRVEHLGDLNEVLVAVARHVPGHCEDHRPGLERPPSGAASAPPAKQEGA